MSFEHRPSPARVTSVAAAKMPRWMLAALLLAFIVPGLVGRDPWSLQDAASFGVMWTMAQGTSADWLLPNVLGEPVSYDGPLPYWTGAVLIRIFGGVLAAIDAARLTTLVWFVLAVTCLWFATYRLARRPEAQPVALAFGGEASSRDFGRMVADIAVLLTVATLGVTMRLHETSNESALFALVAALLLALTMTLERPHLGVILAGLVLGGIALTAGLLPAVVLLVPAVAFVLRQTHQRGWRSLLMIAVAVTVAAAWPIVARGVLGPAADAYFDMWWQWNLREVGPRVENLIWLGRNSGWYLWPLWPFALWALYSWRAFLRGPHLQLPLSLAAAALVGVLVSSDASDRQMIVAVAPIVVLAALGVPVLRRGAEDAIDWFSIAMFSLVLIAVWVYFVAWHAGVPPRMAASVERVVPGLAPVWPILGLLVALVATTGWLMLSAWRLRMRPPMMWRGPFLAAGGVTVLWIVAVSLFAGPIDYSRSYAPTAEILRQQVHRIAPGRCVEGHHLPLGARAMLAFHGGLRFGNRPGEPACPVVIHRDSRRSLVDDAPPIGDWQLAYEHIRRVRYDEAFRIWARPAL